MRARVFYAKFFVTISIFSILFLNCNSQQKTESSPFGFKTEKDAKTGWEVITLSYKNAQNDTLSFAVQLVPQAGNKVLSYIAGNEELLAAPNSLKGLSNSDAGIEILYPTPLQVRDAKIQWGEQNLEFAAAEGKHRIQNLVNNASWNYEAPTQDPFGVSLKTWLDFEEGKPWFTAFPFKHRINIEYKLKSEGLQITFKVENNSNQVIPFGFGVKPSFTTFDSPKKVELNYPGLNAMEIKDGLPTGKLLPPKFEPQFSQNSFVSLSEAEPLSVYWGMTPLKPVIIHYLDKKINIILKTSSEFTHATYEVPDEISRFSVTSQTCSPDAHNLQNKGLIKQAHIITVEPGKSTQGFIQYVVTSRD